MANSFRLWLLIAALLAGALLVACGGNGDNGDGDDADDGQPTATEVVNGDTTDGDGDGNGDGDGGDGDGNGDGDGVDAGGNAFDDVPLPAGADEIQTVTISGTDLPFPVPPGTDFEAATYGEWTMKVYDVGGSPGDILEFYKDRQAGWDEVFSVSTDEGGFLIWTRGDGSRAVWIVAGEGSESGTTSLNIREGRP